MANGLAGAAGTWVLVTFGAYLVVLLGIGLYASRLMDTVSDYVIGGRRVGPVVTGFSERASEMSGWLTLAVPADAFGTGVMAFYNGLGMIPADLFAWAAIAKRLRKYTEIVRAVTLPTFFATRLGDDTGLVKGVSALMASVDLARRLVLRADAAPDAETLRVEDVLVLPATLSAEAARDRATETVHEWTRRKFALGSPPDVSVSRTVAAYKLFWLASRPDSDVLVDSVRGTETPYDG